MARVDPETRARAEAKAVRDLVEAQAALRDKITRAAVKAARSRAKAMRDADWRDRKAVTKYAKDAARISTANQRQAANVTSAYQTRVLGVLTGKPVAPARQVDVTALRGIPQESTYGRLADYYRYLVDNPDRAEPEPVALDLVVQRAEEVAEMDVQLAVRAQNHQVTSTKTQVRFYRRVIHPELNESGASCGLCIVASDRVYGKKDLLPIHFRCKCEVVPVTDATRDYGHQLNQDDLHALYEAAGANTARKLKETRFTIHEHGELGPVLAYKGNRFRGPSQVADDTTHGKPTPGH